MNKSCFIEGCSKYKEKNTSFHRFPTDTRIYNRWSRSIKAFNNQENAYTCNRFTYVCGHHFAESDKYINGKNIMLYKNAVPSIFPILLEKQHNPNELIIQSFISPCQESPNSSANKTGFLGEESMDDPLAEKTNSNMDDHDQGSRTNSECEDFLGFDAADLKNEIVNASTGEVYVVFEVFENDASHENRSVAKEADDKLNIVESKEEVKNIISHTNVSDHKETDDELIFVENTVEIIEIDDDDDDEIPPQPTRKTEEFSRFDIQQMVYSNHPLIELRHPQLNWKSDQFRLVYVNGETQNLYVCTQCFELFDKMNIDTIVKHARCNPTPCVSPTSKRRKLNDQRSEENSVIHNPNETLETSVQNLTISKIQTIAACMDVQKSTFFQGKIFLQFAQFLIDAGASAASTNKNKFICEPKYDVLCTFRDQLKDRQVSKISAILNTPDLDFSFSCDVWEDTLRRKTNVLLELHYLDTGFLRHRIVIGMRSVNGMTIDDAMICEQILEILKIYSKEENGREFIQKSTAFVTSGNFDIRSLGAVYFTSACCIINDVANGIINEGKLRIVEKCLQIVELINAVSIEKITIFDARKWENIFELMQTFNNKKSSIGQREVKTIFPHDNYIVRLLEPFHNAITELSDSKNNITKVFGVFKMLETNLMPLASDKEIVKSVKIKALARLRTAFAASDIYQICMFLDPSNRDQYNSLESDKMDVLQSKIDAMINPYTTSKENGCVDNDLIHYMDDSVTSQQNQIDAFLQLVVPSKDDALEFWRCNELMPGLKILARKYFTIPTYASLSECIFSNDAKEYLVKRSSLEIKDLETMLMMNSLQIDTETIK